jgi:hypothetical protein
MAFGSALSVDDPKEKTAALEGLVEKLTPGRWKEVRQPNDRELKATTVLWMDLAEASAKIRTGGPNDDLEDMEQRVWAGVVPMTIKTKTVITDKRGVDVPPPDYLKLLCRFFDLPDETK